MIRTDYNRYLSNVSYQILRLFPLIIALFVILFMNRLTFYSLYADATYDITNIIKGFVLGMRYDSATIMYGLSIPILLFFLGVLIPSENYLSFSRRFSRIWTTIIICFFFMIFFIDVFFYEFYQDHLNIVFFDVFEDDTVAVLKTVWKNYPVLTGFIGFTIIGFTAYYFSGKVFRSKRNVFFSTITNGFILVASLILFAIMARASFSLFPINMMDAAYTNDQFLNKLAPNPVFTFEKAIEARSDQVSALPFWRLNKYKDDIQTAFSKSGKYFIGLDDSNYDHQSDTLTEHFFRKTKANKRLSVNPPHLVIILMEGFGSWILDYESEEFQISCGVSDWIEKSIYFDHFVQSGYSSIQNLAATILSLPSIPERIPFTQRKYGIIPFESAFAEKYRQQGYETTFVYGGKLSWQRIGDFIPHQGFDNVYGEGDFNMNTPKTDWGVYDEYLFDFVYEKLVNADSPQFIMLFTTTNHPPFDLPTEFIHPPLMMDPSLKGMILENWGENLAQKRFHAYQYASCQLNGFLKDIYDNSQIKNVVTAVTADHNLQGIRHYAETDVLSQFRIPFFILGPETIIKNPRIISSFGSHVDIAPTLMELTTVNTAYLSFGKNLLSDGQKAWVVNQNGFLFSNEFVLHYDYPNGPLHGLYQWKSPNKWELERIDNLDETEKLLDAMTAYYSVASYYLEEEWDKKSPTIANKKGNK